jgi:glycosyltransferase involved in cell wall biosynthesis
MKLIIVTPFRFEDIEQAKKPIKNYLYRVNDLFEEIYVILRIKNLNINPTNKKAEVNKIIKLEENVFIYPLEYYFGFKQFIIKLPKIIKDIKEIKLIFRNCIFLFKGVDTITPLLSFILFLQKRHWGIQLMGDPYTVYAKKSLNINCLFILRYYFYFAQKIITSKAKTVWFVSERYLQARYPASKNAAIFNFSDVIIPDEVLMKKPKIFSCNDNRVRLVFIGSLDQRYKGLHILLNALAICLKEFPNIYLFVIGDGKYKNEYINLCDKLALSNNVEFKGFIKDFNDIKNLLDQSDLFVLPSFTEGLPRAMIEAIARGLPCIGTRVGGIPELLSKEDIVEPGDVDGLATLILNCVRDPRRLMAMSERNIKTASKYTVSKMVPIKRAFFEALKEMK